MHKQAVHGQGPVHMSLLHQKECPLAGPPLVVTSHICEQVSRVPDAPATMDQLDTLCHPVTLCYKLPLQSANSRSAAQVCRPQLLGHSQNIVGGLLSLMHVYLSHLHELQLVHQVTTLCVVPVRPSK